jgi:Cu-Zn family superoxide dismutase
MANLKSFLTALALLVAACTASSPPKRAEPASLRTTRAVADLLPIKRSNVRGMVRVRATDDGLWLKGQVSPLPHGRYGFGIHENGDCTATDGKSAGGYFKAGAGAEPAGRLEDLVSGESEVAKLDLRLPNLALSGPSSVLGKSIVVHAWPYDPKQDLSSVPYLACGVIQAE